MVDLNDREIADFSEKINYFPRVSCNADIVPVDLEEVETDEGATGYSFKCYVDSVEAVGKKSEWADALPEIGDKENPYSFWLKLTGWTKKTKGLGTQAQRELRVLLAALAGEKHTPDFDANAMLRKLEKLRAAGKLSKFFQSVGMIEVRQRGRESKEKEDQDGNLVRYFNVDRTFHAIEFED